MASIGEGKVSMEELLASDQDINRILTGDGIKAGHKIQINFGPGRSSMRDFKALLTLWESGKFFHGGGDGVMYSCLDHRLFERSNTTAPSALPLMRRIMKDGRSEWGCGSPIGSADIRGEAAMCPSCKNLIPCHNLTGQIPFNGSVGELAELTTIFFHKLQDNADIYCKFDKTDIRYEMQVSSKGVEVAHQLRGLLIYPLYRIMQDIGSGASIESRFKAFFLA